MTAGRPMAVAWCAFQPRTRALAQALGGQAHFVDGGRFRRHAALLPLRYLRDAAVTWRTLQRQDPSVVLAITSPVFAPLVAWLWCWSHRRPLVIDCHTDAFHDRKWRWARPVHGWLSRRARAMLLHTEEDEALAKRWGGQAFLFPDDLPDPAQAAPVATAGRPRVVVAGSLDSQEPVETALEAAALLPDVELRFTGDPAVISAALRARAPANAVFTGWLAYPRFLGELQAAGVVAAFSIDPHIMNRAAFEAIALGRPLVLSDLPQLRARFGEAALYCANTPAAMAQALRQALHEQALWAERSARGQARLRGQWEAAWSRLSGLLPAPAPADRL
jgi:glycosyltransferase involved in cell wall biosynthesis